MSLKSLLNKRCSWKRRVNIGENSFGELIYSEVTLGSDVLCAQQVGRGLNVRQQIDEKEFGISSYMQPRLWLMPTDIQEGDIVTIDGDDAIVKNVRDAAGRGHHYELMLEKTPPIGEADSVVE